MLKTKIKKVITFDFFIPKPYRVHIIYWLIILNIIIFHQLYDQYQGLEQFVVAKANTQGSAQLSTPTGFIAREVRVTQPVSAKMEEDSLTDLSVQEWVRREVETAGLKWSDVDCLIRNESGWNEYAINKNKNGTFDLGLVQINDIHKVSRKDAFNYKFSTKWMISKRLRDGNYNAWYGYDKCK